jgi:hypothetical protein
MEFYKSLTDKRYKYIVVLDDGKFSFYDFRFKIKRTESFGLSRIISNGYTLVIDDDELAKLMLLLI